MSHFFLDSSALVKKYVSENGTDWITQLCSPALGNTLYVVRISGAEITAALFRRARAGDFPFSDAEDAVRQFKNDFEIYYQIVEVSEQVVDTAMLLTHTYSLRGYDSVQLAAALELQKMRAAFSLSSLTFVSADKKLNLSAAAENLLVENPNDH